MEESRDLLRRIEKNTSRLTEFNFEKGNLRVEPDGRFHFLAGALLIAGARVVSPAAFTHDVSPIE